MVKEFGLDYGVKPRLILAGDFSFAENFDKARCIAFNFVHQADSAGNMTTTEMGFLFEVKEYAEKFMDNLMLWVIKSDHDGDAVDMEFIEKLDGDYILAFGPNKKKLIERMVPQLMRGRIDPIVSIATKGKLLSVGNNYRTFKSGYVKGRRIIVRMFTVNGSSIEESDRYFVKTEFGFSTERELPTNSIGHALLAKERKPFKLQSLKKAASTGVELIEQRRMDEMHYFFPLLLDKIENEAWLWEVINGMPGHIERSESLQAICNLVLLERLRRHNPQGVNTNRPGHDVDLLRYLLNTVESFDSYFPPTEYFTKSAIKKQVKLDKHYLTEYLKKP